jgi:hypothetical protein
MVCLVHCQTGEVAENTVLHLQIKENRLACQRKAYVRLHGSVTDGRVVRKKPHRNSERENFASYLASVQGSLVKTHCNFSCISQAQPAVSLHI